MVVSSPVPESFVEDIQSVESDIGKLYDKFIKPIENIRSHAVRPSISLDSIPEAYKNKNQYEIIKRLVKNINFDTTNPSESRTHAFYRMIGLPVVANDGSFYNPGYNSTQSSSNYYNILSNLNNSFMIASYEREFNIKKNYTKFANQSYDASVWATTMVFPKNLSNMDDSLIDTVFTLDKQEYTVQERNQFNGILQRKDGTLVDYFFADGQHMLKPFIVDPLIEGTVIPYSSKICVPFLPNSNSTKINSSKHLQKPIIEYILTKRLGSKSIDAQNIMSSIISAAQVNPQGMMATELRNLSTAILDNLNISTGDILGIVTSETEAAINIAINYIKTIKSCVKTLANSVIELQSINSKVNWFPMPNKGGPETGANFSDLLKSSIGDDPELEVSLKTLAILKTKTKISDEDFYSFLSIQRNFSGDSTSYGGDESADVKTSAFEEQYNELLRQKNSYGKKASNLLKNIEIITGEISGLGLIDIFAIYTALYTINIEATLALLDNDAFDRLYQNKTLRTSEVEARKNGKKMPVTDAIGIFQKRVSNILKFADSLLKEQLAESSLNASGAP